jgi:membrane protease YdiL (CAAX protease family)
MEETVDEARHRRERGSVPWVFAETLLATALALYLSLRLETTLVWLLLPLGLIVTGRRSPSAYGLDLRIRPPALSIHATLGLILLSLYALGHAVIAIFVSHEAFAPRLPENAVEDLVRGFLVVALPEEVFFRAYVQSRWDLAYGRPWHLFGAALGPGLVIQAVLFAVCHLATGDWTRLRVFFFGLLAGWLRARSESVLGPAVYHAVANFWVAFLATSFR